MFLINDAKYGWIYAKDIDDAENYIRHCLLFDKDARKCQLYRWYDATILEDIEGWDEDMVAWTGDEEDLRIYTRYEFAVDCLGENSEVLLFVEVPLRYSVEIVDRSDLEDGYS